jgi:hypothetical protein
MRTKFKLKRCQYEDASSGVLQTTSVPEFLRDLEADALTLQANLAG